MQEQKKDKPPPKDDGLPGERKEHLPPTADVPPEDGDVEPAPKPWPD